MKYIFLCLIVFIFIISFVHAGTRHTNVNDKTLIENAINYDCVVQIIISKKDGDYRASGVLISKDTILTSAHILYDKDIEPKNINIIYNSKKYKITTYKIHQDFKYKLDNDLAIVKIFGFIDTKYPDLYDRSDELGKLAYLGGYGAKGTGDTGYNSWDFQLRIGTNTIEYILGDLLMCTLSRNNHTKYEFITTPGDSGGGLFIDGKLAGINSSLFGDGPKSKPNGKYNNASGHTRISKHLEWIKDNI